jgi:hypothetical protein
VWSPHGCLLVKPNRERAGGDTDDDGSDNPLFLREAEALPLVRKPDFQATKNPLLGIMTEVFRPASGMMLKIHSDPETRAVSMSHVVSFGRVMHHDSQGIHRELHLLGCNELTYSWLRKGKGVTGRTIRVR